MRSTLALLILYVSYVTCRVHNVTLVRTYSETLNKMPTGLDNYTLSGNLSLGTPPQHLTVLFDTTSSQFWVADSSCSDSDITNYISEDSSTFNQTGGLISDSYFTDSDSETAVTISGSLGVDTLRIGGAEIDQVFFGTVDELKNVPTGFDGVLGLAFQQASFNSFTSSMEDILKDKQFTSKSVSLFVSENSSALILGGIDLKYAKSSFQYVPVIGNGLWSFIGHINVGSIPIAKNSELIIASTTTESILLPGPVFSNFLQVTGITKSHGFQPESIELLRPIEIVTKSGTLTIPSSVYMAENESSLYQLAIREQDQFPGMVVLGEKFLELYYTHLDYENERIGFAEAADI